MLPNESIWPGTEKASLFCVLVSIKYVTVDHYSISFTALVFSVGIWCPDLEGGPKFIIIIRSIR